MYVYIYIRIHICLDACARNCIDPNVFTCVSMCLCCVMCLSMSVMYFYTDLRAHCCCHVFVIPYASTRHMYWE